MKLSLKEKWSFFKTSLIGYYLKIVLGKRTVIYNATFNGDCNVELIEKHNWIYNNNFKDNGKFHCFIENK